MGDVNDSEPETVTFGDVPAAAGFLLLDSEVLIEGAPFVLFEQDENLVAAWGTLAGLLGECGDRIAAKRAGDKLGQHRVDDRITRSPVLRRLEGKPLLERF